MRHLLKIVSLASAALGLSLGGALAGPLVIANTNFPAVNCVYETDCIIHVGADSHGNFTPPQDAGTGLLQSRTFHGVAPAPAGGKGGYMYRIDMTAVKGIVNENCVTKIDLALGTLVKEPYPPGAGLKDMFFASTGGVGSVGIASASQSGAKVTVVFASGGVCPGQSSFFFGFTSAITVPVTGVAMVYFNQGQQGVDDRQP